MLFVIHLLATKTNSTNEIQIHHLIEEREYLPFHANCPPSQKRIRGEARMDSLDVEKRKCHLQLLNDPL